MTSLGVLQYGLCVPCALISEFSWFSGSTHVRFVGDLPVWAGLLLAFLAGLAAWRYYRRESHDLPGRLRWVLPLLRAVAFFLVVMILTGPILHHRRVIGQLGRVMVFLDTSQSMEATDSHMPVARKLLIARRLGWLPSGHVDTTIWEMADRLARARRDATAVLDGQTIDAAILDRCRQSLAQELSEIADGMESYQWTSPATGGESPGAATWLDTLGRFQADAAEPARAILDEPLDDDAARADVANRLLQLSDSTSQFEQALLEALDEYGRQLAASGSRPITSALAMFDRMPRFGRAEKNLLDPSTGILAQLSKNHDVELFGLSGSQAEGLWDARVRSTPPTELAIRPLSSVTDLSGGIAEKITPAPAATATVPASESDGRTAVVLITDGRHNSGSSPLETARVLGAREIPVYTVGFGSTQEPPDLALVELHHPEMVFQKDRLRGTVVFKDRMPPGQSFAVQIGHGGEILWQEQLTTQDLPLRRVDFEFSIDALVQQLGTQLDPQVRHYALPLSLQASISPLEGETETSNNQRTMRFMAVTRNYRLLLIDGRPRWETRYLRNVFSRDEQWHVDTILVGPATDQPALPRGDTANMFPTDEAALFDYDLIIFGEVPAGVLADHEQAWIRSFVERRGGGLVFIDGRREHLRLLNPETLGPLLPVSWLPGRSDALPTRLQLTNEGAANAALMLQSTGPENREFWHRLPVPHALVWTEALPGTEVLVEAAVGGSTVPVMVTRSFGAGRVLYSASDETWRWRYKVADGYHQRFWNQVAKWVMQRPFAVSSEFVSLDSGPPSYAAGRTAEIRARLRGTDGRPVSDATVDALLWRDGRIVSTVSLTAEGAAYGVYAGRTAPLSEGQYEVTVQASGFSNQAMNVRTSFVVLPPRSEELQETACNDGLLREMSLASGGRFLREEQIGQLAELLGPLSTGHVVESDTLLWQSYWWFLAIVGLLTIEWILRKRAGLL